MRVGACAADQRVQNWMLNLAQAEVSSEVVLGADEEHTGDAAVAVEKCTQTHPLLFALNVYMFMFKLLLLKSLLWSLAFEACVCASVQASEWPW